MAEDRFQELKEKYVLVLSVLNRKNFQVQNLHVDNNKLLVRAIAPDQEAKNEFWDAVKKVSADYSKDFVGDITVKPVEHAKPAAAPPPAPAAAKADVKPVGGVSDAPTHQTYVVVSGDTLSKIAKKFYGNANAYMQIFNANTDQLKDPDKIQVGQVLKIPPASKPA